jgi:hypothetical protein
MSGGFAGARRPGWLYTEQVGYQNLRANNYNTLADFGRLRATDMSWLTDIS